jgi:hypothetical protein
VKVLAGALLRPKTKLRLDYSERVDPDVHAVTLVAKPSLVVSMLESAPDHMMVENTSSSQSAIVVITIGHSGRAEAHRRWGLLDLLAGVLDADITLTGGIKKP